MFSLAFPSLYFLLKAHSHSHWLPWFSLFWGLDAQTIHTNVLTGSLQPSLLQRLGALSILPSWTAIFIIRCHTGDQCQNQAKKQHKSISLLIKQESQGTERLATVKSILTVGNPNTKVLHPLLLWLEIAINYQYIILSSGVIAYLSYPASFQCPNNKAAEEIGRNSTVLS